MESCDSRRHRATTGDGRPAQRTLGDTERQAATDVHRLLIRRSQVRILPEVRSIERGREGNVVSRTGSDRVDPA